MGSVLDRNDFTPLAWRLWAERLLRAQCGRPRAKEDVLNARVVDRRKEIEAFTVQFIVAQKGEVLGHKGAVCSKRAVVAPPGDFFGAFVSESRRLFPRQTNDVATSSLSSVVDEDREWN